MPDFFFPKYYPSAQFYSVYTVRNEAYKTDQLINSVQDIKMKFARMKE